ncbi:MAG: hypothetical protein WBD36_04435 [Bacteroidota bacterium]
MHNHLVLRLGVAVIVAGVTWFSSLRAQDTKPALTVFRSMAQNIADEVSGNLAVERSKRISLVVESARLRIVLENAFLEALRKNGYRAGIHDPSADASLKVLSLEETMRYDERGYGTLERTISLTLEIRIDSGEESRMLGNPARQVKDTVDEREELPAGEESRDDGWESVAGPLVVIGAAIVLVYLFFTVRS